MYALIKTNGASHIAIYLPHESLAQSSAALARMLELNSTFIVNTYYDLKTVEPEISFILGDKLIVESNDKKTIIKIDESSDVIDENFEICAPEVFISFEKKKQEYEENLRKLRTENEYLKQKIAAMEVPPETGDL